MVELEAGVEVGVAQVRFSQGGERQQDCAVMRVSVTVYN